MRGIKSVLAICGLFILLTAAGGTAAAAPLAGAPQSPAAGWAGGPYVVQRGETLSSIALRVYGNAGAWSCIWAANRWIVNPNYLQAGWRITLPASCSSGGWTPPGASGTYIVQRGDNLSTIAWRVYGNASGWQCIWAANNWIPNPNYLQAGWRINIPPGGSCGGPPPGPGPAPQGRLHTVRAGETLSGIACYYYSDCNYWRIYNANRDRIWNVNYVPAGTVLRIP